VSAISKGLQDCVRETSEEHGTIHQAGAEWAMLYSSEGLTFGLRPNALGLRTYRKLYGAKFQSQGQFLYFRCRFEIIRGKTLAQRAFLRETC
jgi:hypothetical protein